ncbi:MAG: hypothetical protein ABXS92_03660 [Sulfurimonas sp.]
MNKRTKKSILLIMVMALSTLTHAKAVNNLPAKIHAETPGLKDKNFPKGYFLIPHNLPFLMGLVLKHPKSDTLELTKEQKEKLTAIMKGTKSGIIKKAKEVRGLEMKLRVMLVKEGKKASELFGQVDEIAKLKADITKKHMLCIEKVRAILAPEQYKKIQAYGGKRE